MESVEQRVVLSTVFVSPTGSLDGHAAFTNIQAAVNAVSPGTTIEVGAGTYTGNVAISKAVTLLGARANLNPNQTKVAAPAPSVENGLFSVTANNVTINGFTVKHPFGADILDVNGVSGLMVLDNILENANEGVGLAADHATTINDNLITSINGAEISVNPPPLFGGSQPSAGNDIISNNVIEGSTADGIDLNNSSVSTIAGNMIQNVQGIGIKVSNSNNIYVQFNSVQHTGNHGIEVSGGFGVEVQINTLQLDGGDGILLSDTGPDLVESNTVLRSDIDGICLSDSNHVFVGSNTVEDCDFGIFVTAPSVDNTLEDNTALSNTNFDLEDFSTGHGTAGTANTWTGNIEKKDNHNGGLGH